METKKGITKTTTIHKALFNSYDFFHHVASHLIEENGVRLSLSVTNRCLSGCLHCITNSNPLGSNVGLRQLEKLDHRYFRSKYVGLNTEGEPLDYKDEKTNSDFGDLIKFFHDEFGVEKVEFLTGGVLPNEYNRIKVLSKLIELKENLKIGFDVGLSFHLYWPTPDNEIERVAKERFKFSLLYLSKLSNEFNIQLRGDLISKDRNLMRAFKVYEELLKEMNLKRFYCEGYPKCCGGSLLCFSDGKIVLHTSPQLTQPWGKWKKMVKGKFTPLLDEREKKSVKNFLKIPLQFERKTKKRWIKFDDINSFYARTNGDVDIHYSVVALGKPFKIANIYEDHYEVVVDKWIDYLWKYYFYPNRNMGKGKKLFEEREILLEKFVKKRQ